MSMIEWIPYSLHILSVGLIGNGLVSIALGVRTGLFSMASSVDVEWFLTMSGVDEDCV